VNASDLHRMRDAIHVALMVREGEKLTEDVARERANNITAQIQDIVDDIVTAALKEAARGEVVTGTIGAQPTEQLDTAIGTVRAPKGSDEPPSRYYFGEPDPRDVRGPCGHYGCSGDKCDNEPPF